MTDKDFEILVHRIFELIKVTGATVEFDVSMPHPDGIGNNRQIDSVITLNNKTILIECRLRKCRQDIGWIDSLKGKKDILKANAIVGISASGFTKSAAKVAKHEGIQLFDLNEVTDSDILSSVLLPSMASQWIKFESLDMFFPQKGPNRSHIPSEIVNNQIIVKEMVQSLINEAHEEISLWPLHKTYTLSLRAKILSLSLKCEVKAKVQKIEQDIGRNQITLFGPYGLKDRSISIHELGENFLVDTPIKGAIIMDVSGLVPDKNCYFYGVVCKSLDDKKLYDVLIKNKPLKFMDEMEVRITF
ncbi:MAG: restriction endonuclease [Fulvivirga sp.]